MLTKLLNGLDKDDEIELRQSYAESRRYRERLRDTLLRDREAIITSMTLDERKNNPNWAYEQAQLIGQLKEIQSFLKLIE